MIEEATGAEVAELVAIGGGAASDLWLRILADASGKLLKRSETVEASCLGAAICAAAGDGWFPTIEAAAQSMSGHATAEFAPEQRNHARYAELLSIYRGLYPQLHNTCAKLARFAAGS